MREDGFLTSTTVGPRQFLRFWPFGDGEPRLLGSMEAIGVSDAVSRWLAYAHGRKIFLRSLDDWASPPRLLAEHPADAANLQQHDIQPRWRTSGGGRRRRRDPDLVHGRALARFLSALSRPGR